MKIIGLIAIIVFLSGIASGQEEAGFGDTFLSSIDITSILIALIFFITILLIVVIPARSYSSTNKLLLKEALDNNRELPEELQEPVSAVIKAFPQPEPLGLPRGSLLAVVMLIFSFAFVVLLLFPPEQMSEMVKTLETILAVVIGFYFGSRYAESRARIEPAVVKEIVKEEVREGLPEEKREEKKKRGRKREELI